MDSELHKKLSRWLAQIEKLKEIEGLHFQLEANEKPLFYKLFGEANVKTISEREAYAHSHPDWQDYQKGLAVSKSEWNAERRKLELLQSSFQAEYLEVKQNHDFIRKANE